MIKKPVGLPTPKRGCMSFQPIPSCLLIKVLTFV